MRKWYEPRKNRPDLTRADVNKRGMVGFLEMLWREFFELIKLNLLFIITCIPVVTIPSSIMAMSSITVTMVSDKNHFLWQDYKRAIKCDFWRALVGGVIYALALVAFAVGTRFYYSLMQSSQLFVIFAAFSACLLVLTLSSSFYFFPMLARVDLPVKALIKNSVILTFKCWKKTIIALAWTLLLLLVGVGLLPLSSIFLFFLMFSLWNLTTTYIVWPSISREVLGERDTPAIATKDEKNAEHGAQELRSASIDELIFEDESEDKNNG